MSVKIPVPSGLILQSSYKAIQVKKRKSSQKPKKKSKSSMGRLSRNKGHNFERSIAIKFREIGYSKACRQLEYQEGKGVDLANTGIYQVQCKRSKKYASLTAINEVPFAEGKVPLLIAKSDFGEILVALPLSHFLQLIKITNQGVTLA